jgi:transposase
VPRALEVHVVLDNLSAHKAAEVREWLAKPRQQRWHLHLTPTSSSWLNLVEGWFRELTQKRLRRGSFCSLEHLIEAITLWAAHWNDNPDHLSGAPKPTPSSPNPPRTPHPQPQTNSTSDH